MAAASVDAQVDEPSFRNVLGRFATGVAVVTALDAGGPLGFTCQSLVSLSLTPPLVGLAPAKTSASWPRIAAVGYFCVNVLSCEQEPLARRFAATGVDRFAGLDWDRGASGAPILRGTLAHVECAVEAVHDTGDHVLVVGAVQALGARPGRPLLFYRSAFTTVPGAG